MDSDPQAFKDSMKTNISVAVALFPPTRLTPRTLALFLGFLLSSFFCASALCKRRHSTHMLYSIFLLSFYPTFSSHLTLFLHAWKQARSIGLKLEHNVQNDLNSPSSIFPEIRPTVKNQNPSKLQPTTTVCERQRPTSLQML